MSFFLLLLIGNSWAIRMTACFVYSLTEPTRRPVQVSESSGYDWARPKIDSVRQYTWRAYDAVGPETMTMLVSLF